jgi:hypothetical protein
MRISEYSALLEKALPKGRRILAVGKPGVGKSFTHRQVCARLGWDYIPLCSPLQSPVKIGGYPRPPADEGGDATHCLFDGIAKAFRAERPTYLVFDDLGMAGGETLKAIVDLIQFGRIDNRTLPECVTIGGATNDVGHGADVQGLIEPLKTRWHTIVNIETNVDDVVGYGLGNGWPSDLCAFLRNAPDSLHDWKPSKSMSIDGACPRGWEYVAQWINDGIDDSEVIAGCVGKGRATQYLAFRKLINDLPDVDHCLLDPDKAPVPGNPSAQWLVSMALASKMTAGNFGQAVKYLSRLPAMFRAFSIRDAFRAEATRRADKTLPKGWTALSSSRDFTAWAVSTDGKDVMSAAS